MRFLLVLTACIWAIRICTDRTNYYNEVLDRGTYFVKPSRIKAYFKNFIFKDKRDNIIGLQVSDLAAYPITRYVLDKDLVNSAFDILESKIYSQDGRQHGLKVLP